MPDDTARATLTINSDSYEVRFEELTARMVLLCETHFGRTPRGLVALAELGQFDIHHACALAFVSRLQAGEPIDKAPEIAAELLDLVTGEDTIRLDFPEEVALADVPDADPKL